MTRLCEFCRRRPAEVLTSGIWAGSAYCTDCMATHPTWLPQPAYLVAQYTPDGPVIYGPTHPVNREDRP